MTDQLCTEVGRILAEAGVVRAFGVASAHNLELLGALQAEGIEIISSRCELAAGHMADGHARASGQPTLLLTSTGPGAGNAVGAFATAAKDCSLVIHVTTSNECGVGQSVHRVMEQSGWHQAFGAPLVDLGGMGPEHLRRVLKNQTGPVSVVIPYREDRRRALVPFTAAAESRRPSAIPVPEKDAPVAGLAPWLASERRLLWIGGGARSVGRKALVELADMSGAAVITTVQAKDLFPYDHPQFAGCTLQSAVTRAVAASASVCLALGSRLTELSTATWTKEFPPLLLSVAAEQGAVDWPGVEIKHIGRDIGEACNSLCLSLESDPASSFGREAAQRAHLDRSRKDRSVPEYVLLDAITSNLSSGDTFVCDTTQLAFWAIGGSRLPAGARFLFPGLLSMGFGVPAAVGACWAKPRTRTVALTGDGSLLSVLPALDDAARAPGRLSLVLMDDDGYGILRPKASVSVARDLCTFEGPDWRTVAAAFGIGFQDVGDPRNLRSALDGQAESVCLLRVDGGGLAMEGWVEA